MTTSSLDVSSKLADDIPLRGVFTDEELGFAKVGIENTIARGDCTTDLSSTLPYNLGKVGRLRITGLELRNFVRPGFDSIGNAIGTARTCRQVFAKGTQFTSGMFKYTIIGPCLGLIGSIVTPSQVRSTV